MQQLIRTAAAVSSLFITAIETVDSIIHKSASISCVQGQQCLGCSFEGHPGMPSLAICQQKGCRQVVMSNLISLLVWLTTQFIITDKSNIMFYPASSHMTALTL
jgi:hypothetical protein